LELLHRWAAAIWPQDAAAALLLLSACAVLAIGLWRRGRSFARFVPPLLLVALCELWLLAAGRRHEPLSAWWPLAAVAAVLLAFELAAGGELRRVLEERPGLSSGRRYLAVGCAVICLTLGLHLASAPGHLLIWEASVIEGFGEALRAGQGAAGFLSDTVLWDEGLVSRGDHSLLYGAPTYSIFLNAGFGVLQLRIFAAFLAAAAVAAVLALSRRFGEGTATVAAFALALSPPLLFYGRYGTSLSGTLLGVLLACWACWTLLAAPPHRWWRAPLAAVALIVATLGYSPGRLVVLALLAVTVAFTAARIVRGELWRLAGLALLVAILAGFWMYQERRGSAASFLNARGEQIVNMMRQPGYLQDFLGHPERGDRSTVGTWLDVAGTLAADRAPEYLAVLGAPLIRRIAFSEVVVRDPPLLPLYIAPLLPFLLLGMASSVRRVAQPEHCTLLGWLLLASLPLLLTTRVDAHRMFLLVVPFALWTAFGLTGVSAALDAARIGAWPRHTLAAILIALSAWSNAVILFPPHPRSAELASAMIAELQGIRGEVVLASIADQRVIGLVELALLERQRRDPGSPSRRLEDEKVRALVDGAAVDEQPIGELVAQVGDGTLLMVPAAAFTGTAGALRRSGLEVVELGPPGSRFWRAARPTLAPGS
jgi:hypothetical protein